MVPTALAASISVYLAYEVPYALLRYMAPLDPHYPMRPDWLVVGFLMAVTLLASLVAGLAPARESLNVDLGAALKGQQSGLTARSRTHRILAVGQIAMSFALVAGAVMFVRQRSNIISVDPGFETEHVLIAPLDIDVPPYTADSAWSLYHTLEQRVLQLPGVRTVSYASATPFEDPGADEIRLPGQAKGRGLQGSMDFVSPKFFDTLGISIVRGLAFENSDVPARGLAQVAVVSQTLARVLWNDEDPIGKVVETSDGRQLFVLGVARNTKSEQFGALDRPRLYLLQSPQSFGGPLFVRFDGDPESLAAAIHSTVKSLDANQMFVPRTLRSKMDDAAAIIGRLQNGGVRRKCGADALADGSVWRLCVFDEPEEARTRSPNGAWRIKGTNHRLRAGNGCKAGRCWLAAWFDVRAASGLRVVAVFSGIALSSKRV